MSESEILEFTKYGRLGASSRMRFLQFNEFLRAKGFHIKVSPLLPDQVLKDRYSKGSYGLIRLIRQYTQRMWELSRTSKKHLLWIEKEAFPWFPAWLEIKLLKSRNFVLDYDDAVFHQYDRNRVFLLRKIFGSRLDRLMAEATLVVCGNEYLARRARNAGAMKVLIVPTVVDLHRYSPAANTTKLNSNVEKLVRIVWIGSPSTIKYLAVLFEPLQILAKELNFVLRVICGDPVEIPGVRTEVVQWHEDREVELISECDIGVMPLHDTPWEQGKCGYKIIQYMACGLPVVASDIGVNSSIVSSGQSGYLAGSTEEWVTHLRILINSADRRISMGAHGRKSVEEKFCVEIVAPILFKALAEATGNWEDKDW